MTIDDTENSQPGNRPGYTLVKGYLTTKDLCERYKVERTTLYRWMKREKHPLPAPRISGKAGFNRWAIDDIEVFEERMGAREDRLAPRPSLDPPH